MQSKVQTGGWLHASVQAPGASPSCIHQQPACCLPVFLAQGQTTDVNGGPLQDALCAAKCRKVPLSRYSTAGCHQLVAPAGGPSPYFEQAPLLSPSCKATVSGCCLVPVKLPNSSQGS